MAGLRIGYAVGHPTRSEDGGRDGGSGTSSLSVLSMHAATAAISKTWRSSRERARNKEVRDFTMKWFADRGMTPTDSQANFMFVNIGRPAKDFREACAKQGVKVARDFPPFEKTHCRISYGTMEEMKKAVTVFGDVLPRLGGFRRMRVPSPEFRVLSSKTNPGLRPRTRDSGSPSYLIASATNAVLVFCPVAYTMYCFPLCMKVIGTALVRVGTVTAPSSLPVALSTA